MHTILVLNPGHFHAALVLRDLHPLLAQDIFVYSEPGPGLEGFLSLVNGFNRREHDPTNWRIHVYRGKNYLERLIEDRKGDIVILAGKNNSKIKHIEALTRAGFSILADKPWVINRRDLPLLEASMAADRPLALDIMTERFEITTILQKRFLATEEVFGKIRVEKNGSPSVVKQSLHYLFKLVDGRPLVRPPWYFDVNVQGEGIVDVSSHLVDMTHWMLFPGAAVDFTQDIEIAAARRWPTDIPLDIFRKITKADRFPDSVQDQVHNDVLHYFCNGEIFYRLKGIPVHIKVAWDLELPAGASETHRSIIKGTRSDLVVRQLPEHGYRVELLVVPHEKPGEVEAAVRDCLKKWSLDYPGLSSFRENENIIIEIPQQLRATHEQHFCQVRDLYLDYLEQGSCPPEERPGIMAEYTLLAEAREMALTAPFEPL